MSVGIRHDDLRRRNRAMVIAAVRRRRALAHRDSRHDRPQPLDDFGHLLRSDFRRNPAWSRRHEAPRCKRGRPQVGLALDPTGAAVVTSSCSMNFLSVSSSTTPANRAGRTPSSPPSAFRKDELVANASRSCGVSLAAARRRAAHPADRARRTGHDRRRRRPLLWSPITTHTDIAFADALEEAFGVPVTVENDCNMIAFALRWRDPVRYREDFIAILLSHGIGMGLSSKASFSPARIRRAANSAI